MKKQVLLRRIFIACLGLLLPTVVFRIFLYIPFLQEICLGLSFLMMVSAFIYWFKNRKKPQIKPSKKSRKWEEGLVVVLLLSIVLPVPFYYNDGFMSIGASEIICLILFTPGFYFIQWKFYFPTFKDPVKMRESYFGIIGTVLLGVALIFWGIGIYEFFAYPYLKQIYWVNFLVLTPAMGLYCATLYFRGRRNLVSQVSTLNAGLEKDHLISMIHHKSPLEGIAAIEQLQKFEDIKLIPLIHSRLKGIPVATYSFSPDHSQAIHELRGKLLDEIERRLIPNQGLAPHFETVLCSRCLARAKKLPFSAGNVVVCRVCYKQDRLITGIEQVKGRITGPTAQEGAVFTVNIWQPDTKTLVPADLDKLEIATPFPENMEWFSAEFVSWVQDANWVRPGALEIEIEDYEKLDVNSQRLLKSIARGGHIHVRM